MKQIVQKENKVLRQIAKEVPISQITSPKIKAIVAEMQDALAAESDGVALAAPQIAVSLRIFVISPLAYEIHADGRRNAPKNIDSQKLVFINPRIVSRSLDRKNMDEGCLSVRPWYGKVRRSSRATVEAYDENGNKFRMKGSGLIAQIFQHEIDHLEGILFIDKAKNLVEIPLETNG